MSGLAVTWWGHSTTTVELGATRVLTDPVFVDRFVHLRRHATSPTDEATAADLVLVSHLHMDHFHLPSLRRLTAGTPVVVPAGSRDLLARTGLDVLEASPGDRLTVAGVRVEVSAADHPATRHRWSRKAAQPVGFRVEGAGRSLWFPGDTGPATDVSDVRPVDLALVPVGGWGPTLGDDHVGPADAADLVRRVGARWAVPVHWGTFWPLGMGRVAPGVRRQLFETPGERFLDAVDEDEVRGVLAEHGRRIALDR
ncbi:MBL fold metallo-hydrolase [Mumia sp. ZJ1417]|uniref:MBL fold metallo-hydrolase n=1 Tax=Mumia sp. ZJ1417 TaxID=2708082 RepID=UPI001421F9B0|nr:MBL fold metallo-hydrolase [Mumia sp. ZJ1417]QMW67523.1 MBL fold metallo-hydrolase [Mumia sp. ZJ1417]